MCGWLQGGPWAKSVLAQHATVSVPTCIMYPEPDLPQQGNQGP